jgi:hypothetical protein
MTDGVYRVTRNEGAYPTSILNGTLLYSTPEEEVAWRFYNLLRPAMESTVALWNPSGELIASRSGAGRRP